MIKFYFIICYVLFMSLLIAFVKFYYADSPRTSKIYNLIKNRHELEKKKKKKCKQ